MLTSGEMKRGKFTQNRVLTLTQNSQVGTGITYLQLSQVLQGSIKNASRRSLDM